MPVQSVQKKGIIEVLSTTQFAKTEDLTVKTTTLSDEEGTTEYPDYGDEEEDNINKCLAISLICGG